MEKQSLYKILFDQVQEGLAVYRAVDNGEDFIFLEINAAAEKIEKVERADLVGKREYRKTIQPPSIRISGFPAGEIITYSGFPQEKLLLRTVTKLEIKP